MRVPTIEAIGATDGRFASVYRQGQLGPISIGEVTFLRDWAVECDEVGSSYYVHLPIAGRFDSLHRGTDLTHSREWTAVFQPDTGPFTGRWTAGYRALCVQLDLLSVNTALRRLVGEREAGRISFAHAVNLSGGFGSAWADLVYSVNRQLAKPGTLLSEPLVAAPLAESILNGFLLATAHSHSEAIRSPVPGARPPVVRRAIELIESDPGLPLTVAVLAEHCDVTVRTLQKGFRRHMGMSPMAYVREVRLRRAHHDLRNADPLVDSVAAVAHRWGFHHLGRFAAAHEARYGQTPLKTLRG
ncbi:AraC family transcriptional regulator [Streptomyces sp. NPDC058653]|uniref:AraC family transcriptional regulator n=1 Tax=Streptomyces sp. NPDC058653 TaxID=3346576 RepID=UPI00365EA0A8